MYSPMATAVWFTRRGPPSKCASQYIVFPNCHRHTATRLNTFRTELSIFIRLFYKIYMLEIFSLFYFPINESSLLSFLFLHHVHDRAHRFRRHLMWAAIMKQRWWLFHCCIAMFTVRTLNLIWVRDNSTWHMRSARNREWRKLTEHQNTFNSDL